MRALLVVDRKFPNAGDWDIFYATDFKERFCFKIFDCIFVDCFKTNYNFSSKLENCP
jgi:hypothetical protein